MTRILIDGRNLGLEKGTGVATYARNLSYELHEMGHGVEVLYGYGAGPSRNALMREIAFFDSNHGDRDRIAAAIEAVRGRLAGPLAKHAFDVPISGRVVSRTFSARLPYFDRIVNSTNVFGRSHATFSAWKMMSRLTMKNPPDIAHWTYPLPIRLKGRPNVYTLHDLVPLKLPHTTLDNKSYYHRLIRHLVDHADHIATVSETSRNDILAMFGADPDRVTNCYQSSPVPPAMGSEADDHALIESVFGLPARGFYLFFGASDPKKNLGRIVDAYLASQSERPLVIVSSRDWGMSEAVGGLGKDGMVYGRKVDRPIIQLQYLPRETLFRLIRSARAVLFPSLYEGFGLPALEAIQLGTSVISSNTSSLPEVVGDGGLLVDPYDTNAIAGAIRRIDGDDALVARLSAAGLIQARKFTSATFAQKLAAMYAKLPPVRG
jgi:glycosyltransferase involved in cell wall biosynthesis